MPVLPLTARGIAERGTLQPSLGSPQDCTPVEWEGLMVSYMGRSRHLIESAVSSWCSRSRRMARPFSVGRVWVLKWDDGGANPAKDPFTLEEGFLFTFVYNI